MFQITSWKANQREISAYTCRAEHWLIKILGRSFIVKFDMHQRTQAAVFWAELNIWLKHALCSKPTQCVFVLRDMTSSTVVFSSLHMLHHSTTWQTVSCFPFCVSVFAQAFLSRVDQRFLTLLFNTPPPPFFIQDKWKQIVYSRDKLLHPCMVLWLLAGSRVGAWKQENDDSREVYKLDWWIFYLWYMLFKVQRRTVLHNWKKNNYIS